jgi:hypothetical protein
MSHRFQDGFYNLEKFPVRLWGYATSADWSAEEATTDLKTAAKSLGIKYIYRTGAGVVKITLKKNYHSVLSVYPVMVSADSSVANCDITTDDVDGATPYVTITLRDHAGSAVDPQDNDVLLVAIDLRNSNVGT